MSRDMQGCVQRVCVEREREIFSLGAAVLPCSEPNLLLGSGCVQDGQWQVKGERGECQDFCWSAVP